MSYTELFLATPVIQVIGSTGAFVISGDVKLTLPGVVLAGAARTDTAETAFVLPQLALTIQGDQSVIGGVAATLPSLALSAAGYQSVVGHVGLTLPAPVLSALVDQSNATLSLPALALVIGGVAGRLGEVRFHTISFAISAAGVTGEVAHVAMQLPSSTLRVTGYAENLAGVTQSLPMLQVAASGRTGVAGGVALNLPSVTVAATGRDAFTGSVGLRLLPSMHISGATGGAARVALSLRSLALAASGVTGTVGSATMVLPVMRMGATGVNSVVGEVVISLPMLAMHATGARTVGANFSTVVMHTESNALTTYENYRFNSFAQFNGVYLGASADGIFALSGTTDDGVLIAAAARVGITDFGTSHLKRVERCYVGYNTDGGMVLRVTTDGQQVRDYLLSATGKGGTHGNHVRIGRGVEARYWQFEILNQDGADFSLDMLEFKPTVLRRRVGGGDA